MSAPIGRRGPAGGDAVSGAAATFDITLRPEGSKHRLFGSVCLCGNWAAGCGHDIPTQWAEHLRRSRAEDQS